MAMGRATPFSLSLWGDMNGGIWGTDCAATIVPGTSGGVVVVVFAVEKSLLIRLAKKPSNREEDPTHRFNEGIVSQLSGRLSLNLDHFRFPCDSNLQSQNQMRFICGLVDPQMIIVRWGNLK